MSDDASHPHANFLVNLRDSVARGNEAFPLGSPEQIAKLADLDARITLGRRLGEIAPAEEPADAVERLARERLRLEWPLGVPSVELSDHLAEVINLKFNVLHELSDEQRARLAREVEADIENRASRDTLDIGRYDPALERRPSGHEQVAKLMELAEPVIQASIVPEHRARFRQLLVCDRRRLEGLAAMGRAAARYSDRKAQLGIAS
ncbi:MAG: hypothetical protein ACREE2_14345 [Stellaceae bacterium]